MKSDLIVKVKREKLVACMKCPLCNNLLEQATTISLCLHTFCRKCIYEKFEDEDVDSCPVCDINLGCVPTDKLRPDHNLQDLRDRIFPLKRRKVEAPEIAEIAPEVTKIAPAISPPAKRKERSLSSLAVNMPRVSSQDGVTGRRIRAGVRKGSATRSANPATEEISEKEEDMLEDRVDVSGSPNTINKTVKPRKSSSAKSSNDQTHSELMGNNIEGRKGEVDVWKPLDTLVEAANSSKSSKPGSQGDSHIETGPASYNEADACTNKVKIDENGQKVKVKGEKRSTSSTPGLAKRRGRRPANKNKLSGSAEPSRSKLTLTHRNWRDGPIWFSLVASGEGVDPLPQVSAAFLSVKDANIPVSHILKYLVKKLDLSSEEEVQVMCRGQPVISHLKISSLLDLWLPPSTTKKVRTFVGHPAQDFMMVLSYSRTAVPVPSDF